MTSSENNEDGGIGVGIDLGTTHSAIAILDPNTGLPTIISIPENGRTMPSVVSLMQKGSDDGDVIVVGKEAIELEAAQGSAYRNVKRIIGRGATAAQDSLDVVPFLLASAKDDKKRNSRKRKKPDTLSKQMQDAHENPAMLLVSSSSSDDDSAFIKPEEISAHVLRKLLQTVEQYTQQRVTRAVIGVPAYFHDAQRDATIQAANLAGLDKVKLLREPEAAALAYGVGKQQLTTTGEIEQDSNIVDDDDDEELVLVFDLGGGTYDVSMLLVGAGLTEIITTSGDGQLGGSDFDAKVALHLRKVLADNGLVLSSNRKAVGGESDARSATDAIVRSSEMVRIYLSNNRKVKMALPLREDDWSHMAHASDIILPLDFEMDNGTPLTVGGISNSTHVLCELTRREMEKLCQDELLALLRPIREVAIMAGALLPGDTSPTIVQAAMQMEEEEESMMFEDFYKERSEKPNNANNEKDEDAVDETMLLQLQEGLDEISMKERKKAQQRGRKKARDVTKRERKYREEKRKLVDQTPAAEATDVKIRDGISGRPISRVVLVGGATRMPAVGRLIAALTGVVPQKTVNPDEAVALGCAVHVGILDGKDDLGTVLNPMQAAILRAVAEQQQKQDLLPSDEFDDNDDEEFDTVEYF